MSLAFPAPTFSHAAGGLRHRALRPWRVVSGNRGEAPADSRRRRQAARRHRPCCRLLEGINFFKEQNDYFIWWNGSYLETVKYLPAPHRSLPTRPQP